MALALDIAALVIFILFLWWGKRRGFIRVVAGILILILACWGAGFLADNTAQPISDKYVTPYIEDFLTPKVEAAEADTPSEFENLLVDLGVPSGMASDIVAAKPVGDLVRSTSITLAYNITYVILCLIFFILLFIILKLLLRVVDKIFDLPILNFANSTLGLVCGGIFGALLIYFALALLFNFGILDWSIIEETYILKFVYGLKSVKL